MNQLAQPPESDIIHLNNIYKSYQMGNEKLTVLHDINLTVKKGDFVAVLGPSGSGKTTLMNIVGCMDRFDSGEYFLAGQAVHKMRDGQLTRLRNRQIGFVFQKYQLIPRYTLLQNVALPLLVRGFSRRTAYRYAAAQAAAVGLADRIRHRPTELSGGQQQRAAIARALCGAPALLLADEPTGALDSVTGREVLDLFCKLNERGNTIVMITHNEEVARRAGCIVRIVDGRLTDQKEG